jgi:hypothetical protein
MMRMILTALLPPDLAGTGAGDGAPYPGGAATGGYAGG